ncbi:hypothetical protein [Deinococcus sp. QL22]|uniref:hypothetical protein n=1 Tax=Deinococcus sp. QL22 TaxID=2939437 RepID=UPI00201781BC|nr:hypothetical protein [Deinococcus sp. QL22]UQN10732.1 hypothetical protein M1R55_31350 [Deinococcus sp. QL22]UQN10777.1 hypothetical protein M1R55_31095 [Deinococcus sp. QL22]
MTRSPVPLPHAATLTLTGWPRKHERGLLVGGLLVRTTHPVTDVPTHRVTVIAYPQTTPDGCLISLQTQANRVRKARGSNAVQLRVVGHLIRIDGTSGTVQIQVYPSMSSVPPFRITLQATGAVLAFDPSTFAVSITGRVLHAGGRVMLLAETIEAVHAPVPERWANWKPKRGYGRAIKRSKDRATEVTSPAETPTALTAPLSSTPHEP